MNSSQPAMVRMATRGSALALRQTEWVANQLRRAAPEVAIEIVPVSSAGDRRPDAPVAALGEGAFVRGVEAALLDGRADIAVHSAKDLPTTELDGLTLAAFPVREDPHEVFIGRDGRQLHQLPFGARVGTSSPRRVALLRAYAVHTYPMPVRGNVDTRLQKLFSGEYEGLVLAAAGLNRLDRADIEGEWLDFVPWLPAAGQGTLAVQCRSADEQMAALLARIDDPLVRSMTEAERAVLRRLGSGCRTPAAALALHEDGELVVQGLLIEPSGELLARAYTSGPPAAADQLGTEVAEQLLTTTMRPPARG